MKVLSLTSTCCDWVVIDQEMKVDLKDMSLMSFPLLLPVLAIEFFRIRTRDVLGVATGAVLLAFVKQIRKVSITLRRSAATQLF
jgi:hypothetical protein